MADSDMMSLLKKIHPLRVAPNSPDTDRMIGIVQKELPFQVHEYPAGLEHNGWVVPHQWYPIKAEIRKDGRLVYDGLARTLGVIGYSEPFFGTVGLDELKKHIFCHPVLDDALVYHCDLYYKTDPAMKNWGFSMTKPEKDALLPGEYQVDLQVHKSGGTMKVADYLLKGQTDKTIVFNAHNCHAGQANDDMVGVVVGIELIKRLARRPKRKYSYRLIVAPEHFGTVFYLSDRPDSEVKNLWCGMFLEMLGTESPMVLQESFTGQSTLDWAAHRVLEDFAPDEPLRQRVALEKIPSDAKGTTQWHFYEYLDRLKKSLQSYNTPPLFGHHPWFHYRGWVGNDETVWDSAGFEIPFLSLSRFSYPQYHSSQDTHEIISEQRLEDSVQAVLRMADLIENQGRPTLVMRRKAGPDGKLWKGLIALSNPKYRLYKEFTDPSLRPTLDGKEADRLERTRWNYLMDCLPRYFDGKTSVLDVSLKHGLDYDAVLQYIRKFEEKGLVELVEGID